jgi:hypothetical protein
MPHYRDGFYRQEGNKLEVWFCVKGATKYKPPDRSIPLNGFISDHEDTARRMIDEDFQARVDLARTILKTKEKK